MSSRRSASAPVAAPAPARSPAHGGSPPRYGGHPARVPLRTCFVRRASSIACPGVSGVPLRKRLREASARTSTRRRIALRTRSGARATSPPQAQAPQRPRPDQTRGRTEHEEARGDRNSRAGADGRRPCARLAARAPSRDARVSSHARRLALPTRGSLEDGPPLHSARSRLHAVSLCFMSKDGSCGPASSRNGGYSRVMNAA